MNAAGWLGRINLVVGLLLTGWMLYLFSSAYRACRADGSDPLGCFIGSFLLAMFELAALILVTVIKIIAFILA